MLRFLIAQAIVWAVFLSYKWSASRPVKQSSVSQPLPKIELTYLDSPAHSTRFRLPKSPYERIELTLRERIFILNRDKRTCQMCGRKAPEVILEIDHIIPVSKGGSNHPTNLQVLCFDCNRGKGADLL
jgi:5-methylcytosine-specific restriction endonuclease McrA